MKLKLNLGIVAIVSLLIACGPQGKKVEATDAKATPAESPANQTDINSFAVDNGTINWTGSKLVGTSSHNGTIDINSGELKVMGDKIVGGTFTVDMASINNLDLEAGKGKEKLEGHLKSPDFFDVAQFPTATFELTEATPVSGQEDITHNVTGNMTIRGISKSITIPANIAIMDNKLTAVTPSFKIDRTQWGVQYRSGSIADLAKDKVINDEIALVLNIEAASTTPLQ